WFFLHSPCEKRQACRAPAVTIRRQVCPKPAATVSALRAHHVVLVQDRQQGQAVPTSTLRCSYYPVFLQFAESWEALARPYLQSSTFPSAPRTNQAWHRSQLTYR